MKLFRFNCLVVLALCATAILVVSSSVAAGIIYVKWNSPGSGAPPVYDGKSWATAFHKVQDGINASVSGDDIWVAAGTYVECVVMKDGIALYGGFSGTETSRDERNWRSSIVILDGNKKGSVVTANGCTQADTRMDGFTVRNGMGSGEPGSMYGGGVYCSAASLTIANNRITGNVSSNGGGGVYCADSSVVIVNNIITGNHGSVYGFGLGGGVYCTTAQRSGSLIVVGNIITANCGWVGGGVYSSNCRITLANNTIAGNSASSGGGIGYAVGDATGLVANNLVAFNSSGIIKSSGSAGTGGMSFRSNCVYGNGICDYSGTPDPTGSDGNIAIDPKLVAHEYGDLHIQPDSPCIDAGDDALAQPDVPDMDGQTRIQRAHVDIGADESDGTAHSFTPSLVRVKTDGDDANDGSRWCLAKRSVQAAIDTASAHGGEVWVKAGTYGGKLSLPTGVHLYGGFNGSETSRTQRDWVLNSTTLDGQKSGSVITCTGTGYLLSTVDGFTITNGTGTHLSAVDAGGGIYCPASCPMITNNIVTGNSAPMGSAIYCDQSSVAVISGNTITGNACVPPGGSIHCGGAAPIITGNRITQNTGVGIRCSMSSPIIRNNTILGSSGSTAAGIVCGCGFSVTVANNMISGYTGSQGLGLEIYSCQSVVTNNTISGNTGRDGGGIRISDGSATLTNNIVAFNSSGIFPRGSVILRGNNVFGNVNGNYPGVKTDPTGTDGNISADPMFVNRDARDYHLLSGSPCIDAGNNTGAPTTDLDGAIRPQDGNADGNAICDIGAYEYPLDLLKAKKTLPDGSPITFGVASVTALFPAQGSIYVERADRSAGVRVDTPRAFDEGKLVNVQGTIQTDPASGERYVSTSAPWPQTTGGSAMPRPLFMLGRDLGGGTAGLQDGVWSKTLVKQDDDGYVLTWVQSDRLNNIGLLVTICGTVTHSTGGSFYVDDGSALDDDSGHKGVKVLAAGLTLPASGFVKVTGISSCEKNGDRLVRVLKVRKQGDISPL